MTALSLFFHLHLSGLIISDDARTSASPYSVLLIQVNQYTVLDTFRRYEEGLALLFGNIDLEDKSLASGTTDIAQFIETLITRFTQMETERLVSPNILCDGLA